MAPVSRHDTRRLSAALRALLTLGLAYAVLRQIDFGTLKASALGVNATALLAAGFFTVVTPALGAFRWQRVLAHVSERVGFGPLVSDLLVGSAYNLVLPTTMGGDVVRALRCSRRVEHPASGYGSVVFERLLGLLALSLAAVLGALLANRGSRGTLTLFCLASLGLLLFGLRFAGSILNALARSLDRFARFAGRLREVAHALEGPWANPRASLEILALSLVYQVCNLSIVAVVLLGFDEPRWAVAAYLGIPLALLISSAPVTIGGFGLREALFVHILADYGVSAERALLLSMLWFVSSLLLALAGLVVLAKERAWLSA
ncbi:MAG: lysylphosphatidylglycerol synthase transmembrane domain-containing protein [Myxococcota bacterium]